MKKVIFVSNHAGFAKFNIPYMDWLSEHDIQVDNASPYLDEKSKTHVKEQYDIPITRSPYSIENIKSIFKLHRILKFGDYDIVHCHTPMGSVVARLASIGIPNTTLLYTAHGFFFYKGCPIKYWLLYFPIEFCLKRVTDYIITINQEDYEIANRFKLATKGIFKINGVGYAKKFFRLSEMQRTYVRSLMGFKTEDFVILYSAQFIARKNHKFVIESIPDLIRENPNYKFVFVGSGELLEQTIDLSKKLEVYDNCLFAGERDDVEIFCQSSDLYISASYQEGLCVGILEAMACGLPLVVTDIRGNNNQCVNERNGFLYHVGDKNGFIESIKKLSCDDKLRKQMEENNIVDVKNFSLEQSIDSMAEIYTKILGI